MSMESRNISCDVYLDLIPLVRDKVASENSNALVYEHIKTCEGCRTEFDNATPVSDNIINDKKIIKSIKKSIFLTSFLFLVFGALFGVYLSNSLGMFYNLLIMPIVGGCGFLIFKKKWYIVPAGIFVLSFIYILIQSVSEGITSIGLRIEIFQMPFSYSLIYTVLSLLGVAIAALIKFALRKEVTK